MTHRLVSLAPGSNESAISYASRLARRIKLSLRHWCVDLAVSFRDLADGRASAIEQVADIAGIDPDCFKASTIVKIAADEYELNRQRLTGESSPRSRVRYCPACLAEDLEQSRAPYHATARTIWSIISVKTCIRHDVALAFAGLAQNSMLHDWAVMISPHLTADGKVRTLPVTRQATAFERYVCERVSDGTVGGDSLMDRLPLHAGMKLAELLGTAIRFGEKATASLPDDDYAAAANEGYLALAGSPGSFEDALGVLDSRSRGLASEGPQARLGRFFYDWLARRTTHPAYEPIRDAAREFILSRMHIARGTMLLGKVVETVRLHSVQSLAKKSGLHPTTLRRQLKDGGFLKIGPSGAELPMDAVTVEPVAAALIDAVQPQNIPDHLGCSRSHALVLRQAGLIRPIIAETKNHKILYARAHLDDFLHRVQACTSATTDPPKGNYSLEKAAKQANCSIAEIIEAIADGNLTATCRADSLRLDQIEVPLLKLKSLVRGHDLSGLVPHQLGRRISTSAGVVGQLIKIGALAAITERHPINRCPVKVVPHAEIQRFEETYVMLFALARLTGRHHNAIKKQLESLNIHPVFAKPGVSATVYRRSDIASILKL